MACRFSVPYLVWRKMELDEKSPSIKGLLEVDEKGREIKREKRQENCQLMLFLMEFSQF
jgi:hypothetical protein